MVAGFFFFTKRKKHCSGIENLKYSTRSVQTVYGREMTSGTYIASYVSLSQNNDLFPFFKLYIIIWERGFFESEY